MVVPFGFSVGDFITVIGVFKDIGTALKATGGASDDYLHITNELESITAVLQTIQNAPNIGGDVSHVNAIRGQAQTTHQLLTGFLRRIEKYDTSLGAGARRGFHHGAASAKWALTVSKDLKNLRNEIDASTQGLKLLQNLHNMNLITSVIHQCESTQQTISSQIEQTEDFEKRIISSISSIFEARHNQTVDLIRQIELKNDTQNLLLLDQLTKSKIDSSQALFKKSLLGPANEKTKKFGLSITSALTKMSNLQLQLLQAISKILFGILKSILNFLDRLFWLSPQLMVFLYTMRKLPAHIGSFLSDDIHLEDALGDKHRLQYQYFRSWEVLRTMLKVQFLGKPGADKVAMGNFRILNARFQDIILDENNWSDSIKPRMKLIMSIEITNLRRKPQHGFCIRTGCMGMMKKLPKSTRLKCSICGFGYFVGSRAQIPRVDGSSEHFSKPKDFRAEVEETRRMLERMKTNNIGIKAGIPADVRKGERDDILKDLEAVVLEAEEQERDNMRFQRHRQRRQNHVLDRENNRVDKIAQNQEEEKELMVFKRIHILDEVWKNAESEEITLTSQSYEGVSVSVLENVSNFSPTIHDIVMMNNIPSALESIKSHIRQGFEVDSEDPCYGTLLQVSTARGSIELMALLLELGADPLKPSCAWRDALQTAASYGNQETLALLLYTLDRRLTSMEDARALEMEDKFADAVKHALNTATLKLHHDAASLLLKFCSEPESALNTSIETNDKEMIKIHVKEAVRARRITAEHGAMIICDSQSVGSEYLVVHRDITRDNLFIS